MDCLKGYITPRWCGGTLPPSGIYLQTLPGVSLDLLSKLTDSDQAGFNDVFLDVQQRAVMRMQDECNVHFNKKYQLLNLRESLNLRNIVDSDTSNALVANTLRGFIIDKRPYMAVSNQFVDSALARINIQSLALPCTTADDGTSCNFIIYDLAHNIQVWSGPQTLATGWNVIEVNQTFDSNYLLCAFDSDVDYYNKSLSTFLRTGASDIAMQIRGFSYPYTTITDPIEQSSLVIGGDSYGLSGTFSLQCAWDGAVCGNKSLFRRSWLLCLGIELMIETLSTTRLNKYTSIGKQTAKDNLDRFTDEFNESLKGVIEGIRIDLSDACIECNAMYRMTDAI